MFKLRRISPDAVPAALEKAARYRQLNEPAEAESICLDVLEVDPESQETLVILLLALTDQFEGRLAEKVPRAMEVLSRLRDEYKRLYYGGVIRERQAKAFLKRAVPGSGEAASGWLREAMEHFDRAAAIRPPGDDSAILRWNTCARIIMNEPEIASQMTGLGEEMLE
jgi:tetratricopeptide (TPR) repeat protein